MLDCGVEVSVNVGAAKYDVRHDGKDERPHKEELKFWKTGYIVKFKKNKQIVVDV